MKTSRLLLISVISLFLIISIASAMTVVSAPEKCDTIFCWIASLFTGKTLTGQIIGVQAINSPADISGLALWLKADAIAGLSDGSLVSTWQDSSGNGRNAVQADSSRQPAYYSNQLNGKSVLRFLGPATNGDGLVVNTNFNSPVTIIYIGRLTGGLDKRVISGVTNNWLLGFWDGHMNSAFFEGLVTPLNSDPMADTNWHMYTAIIPGTGQNSRVYENGIILANNQNGVTGPNGLYIGGGGAGASNECSNSEVAEVIVYNRALSDTERQDVEAYLHQKYFEAAPQQVQCGDGDTQGMVSYWQADTDATDLMGNNNGILRGNAGLANAKVNKGFSLDGNADYVEVPYSSSINFASQFTLEGWIYYSGDSPPPYTSDFLLSKTDSPGIQYSLGRYAQTWPVAGIHIAGQPGHTDCVNTGYYLDNGQWYYLASTFDGQDLKIYVDGALVQTCNLPGAVNTDTGDLWIGGDAHPGWLEWTYGIIDEVAVYNRALPIEDIQAHYDRTVSGQNHYCPYGGAPAECGNSICETGENVNNCPEDCNVCGDSVVYGTEACDSDSIPCTVGGYAGTQTCLQDCSDYGECISGEYCGDGIINNGEVCDSNSQSCYTGPQGTQGVGICAAGNYPCNQYCTGFDESSCIGQVVPQAENTYITCSDSMDNDCDNTCDINGCSNKPRDIDCTPGGGGIQEQCSLLQMLDLNNDNEVNALDLVFIEKYWINPSSVQTTTSKNCIAWNLGLA